jgi:signal transduction histidine kinase
MRDVMQPAVPRGTRPAGSMDFLRQILGRLASASLVAGPTDAHERCEMLAQAAVALADGSAGRRLDDILQVTVRAAARMTRAAAMLAVLDGDGRLQRFAAEGADGCTRETLARPEVLGSLVLRLRALGRPVGPDDLEEPAARTLAALAPHGFLAIPLGSEVAALLVLMEPAAGADLDEGAVAAVTVLGVLARAALRSAERFVALRESREELRRLAREVLSARDRELRRTAHTLHEGICQRLAAANAQLQALDPLLDADPTAARARLRDARALVHQSLGELRELAQELRPSVLEDFGYVQALRWYLARLRARAGVALSLEVEGEERRLPLAMEGALYRATEEALGAVTRSAESGPLRVRFRRDQAAVQLEIAGGRPEALNLVAMRERLRPYGGVVRVTTAGDAPPVIEVNLPAPVN